MAYDNWVYNVSLTGSNVILNGTYTVTGTGTSISSSQVCSAVLVQNDPLSGGTIYVGGSGAQTIALAPGASKEYQVNNVNLIYAKFASGTTSATLNWEARN